MDEPRELANLALAAHEPKHATTECGACGLPWPCDTAGLAMLVIEATDTARVAPSDGWDGPEPCPRCGVKNPHNYADCAVFLRGRVAPSDGLRITHGRHCTCSACAREDWTAPHLAHCGMHGPSCPPVYAPVGPAGSLAQPEDTRTATVFRCLHGNDGTTCRKCAVLNGREDTRTADPGGLVSIVCPACGGNGEVASGYYQPEATTCWTCDGKKSLTGRALTPEATAPDAEGARLAERDRLAGEYGRLLAERDRLIGEGVDPDDLDMPLPPPDAEGEG